jgi:hypothetical protein
MAPAPAARPRLARRRPFPRRRGRGVRVDGGAVGASRWCRAVGGRAFATGTAAAAAATTATATAVTRRTFGTAGITGFAAGSFAATIVPVTTLNARALGVVGRTVLAPTIATAIARGLARRRRRRRRGRGLVGWDCCGFGLVHGAENDAQNAEREQGWTAHFPSRKGSA